MPPPRAKSLLPRRSSGPLSAASLSTLRCPTRADFLRNPPRGRAKSFSSGDNAEQTEIASHLTPLLLDAMDRLEVFPELQAIAMWLDDVRAARGFALKVTDMDLSNGVALLDALYAIDSTLFEEVEYSDVQVNGVPRSYVSRDLDKDGRAARENVAMLRRMLQKFEWRGEGGEKLPGVDFEKVDIWALGGFVVVAAYTCERAPDFVELMWGYDQWVQDCLEDVVGRGLRTLGSVERVSPRSVSSSERTSGEGEWRRRAEDWERKCIEEKRKRVEMGKVVERERRRADMCEREKKRMEQAVKLMENKVKRGAGGDVGVVQQLRVENSRLRAENARLRRVVQEGGKR